MLPQRAQKLISEYAKPITRGDWRKGSKCGNLFKNSEMNCCLHTVILLWLSRIKVYNPTINNFNTIIEDIAHYGELVFILNKYQTKVLFYNNYYFMLQKMEYLNKSYCIHCINTYNNKDEFGPRVEWIQAID
jgi:hypothetical protein